MPKITVLPHAELCPDGAILQAEEGVSICDTLLEQNIDIDHACDRVCACTTCHVIVREGFQTLEDPSEDEEDMLDKAWGLEPHSRLSCQVIIGTKDLVVEIPKYSINLTKEGHSK